MNEKDKHFIKRYEELLDKGYCDCNEMNCIDNNSPRRILNIVKDLQKQLEVYENMRKEAINKLKEHKKDLDYEPWSLYEVRGSILFDLSNILNKVGGSDE